MKGRAREAKAASSKAEGLGDLLGKIVALARDGAAAPATA
jgi:hypothetical protein